MDDLPKRRIAPTISQVAKLAGVSRSSVSRAFSRPDMLGLQTVDRILTAAREIGYVPNPTARALSTGRNANVALVVPDVANPFFPPLIKAAQDQAGKSDFCIFLGNSNEDAKDEDKLIDRVAGQVEGMILVSSRLSEDRIRQHADRYPVVIVNRDVRGIPRVLIDSAPAVEEAVHHLADLGHERVVYISGPRQSWSNRQRQSAVRRIAKARGIETHSIQARLPTYEVGCEIGRSVAAAAETAVIAFDDLIARGVMAGAAETGAVVPTDISVIGCDDVLAAAATPPLTTVSNRSSEAGRTAMALLLDLLRTGTVSDARYALDCHLVKRGSTAPNRFAGQAVSRSGSGPGGRLG